MRTMRTHTIPAARQPRHRLRLRHTLIKAPAGVTRRLRRRSITADRPRPHPSGTRGVTGFKDR